MARVAVKDISKSFPGVKALDGVSIELASGEVHALVGENGSGKSTLVKVLCGVYQPDSGEIQVDGHPVLIKSPIDAQNLGICAVHQEFYLVPQLDVASNVFLGQEKRFVSSTGIINYNAMYQETEQVFLKLGHSMDPRMPVSRLGVALKQLVEIAKVLVRNAKIVIFDEPTAALPDEDVSNLFETIRVLKRQDIAVLYISHRLSEIWEIGDRVTVLRDGRLVCTRLTNELSMDQLIQHMTGRRLEDKYPRSSWEIGSDVILRVESMTRIPHFSEVGFELHEGEILGIAGLVGSGRSELGRALFGLLRTQSGNIEVCGKRIDRLTPREAIRSGIGYIPAERKTEGLVLQLPVRDNIALSSLASLASKLGFLRMSRYVGLSKKFIGDMAIKPADCMNRRVHVLSGGNQQKVVLSKTLAKTPRVLILDEPTRGIDVGARVEVYSILGELARRGVGIVISSSDLQELVGMCNTVLVMNRGRIVKKFKLGEAGETELLRAMNAEEENTLDGTLPVEKRSLGPNYSRESMRLTRSGGLVFSFRGILQRLWGNRTLGIGLLMVALSVLFSFTIPEFLTGRAMLSLLRQAAYLLMVSAGTAIPILVGGIDVSAGTLLGLTSVLAAKAILGIGAIGLWVGPIVGCVTGMALGLVISRYGLAPLVVTLGMSQVYRGLALIITDGQPVFGLPNWMDKLSNPALFSFVPLPFVIALSVLIAMEASLRKTVLGRRLYAIGGSEEASRISGIPVTRYIALAYGAAGLLSGLAGTLFAARAKSGQPLIGSGMEIEAIAAAVLGGFSLRGGEGSLIGVLIAVLALGILRTGMNLLNVGPYLQMLIIGMVLVGGLILDCVRTREGGHG